MQYTHMNNLYRLYKGYPIKMRVQIYLHLKVHKMCLH